MPKMKSDLATATNSASRALDGDALLRQLGWRYATKKYDPAKKISPEDWATLEQALVLTPSSYGLQPWKFFVIRDPAVREQLVAASWGQRQIADASHLVVFAVRKGLTAQDVNQYIGRIAEVRSAPVASLEGFRKMLLGAIEGRTPEQVQQWSARQVYIALGNFLTSAAVLGIDATPMEGLEPAKYDQILGLVDKGYTALFAAAAGYRAEDDAYANLAKVRYEVGDVIEHV
jgi:nitroreductase